MQNLRANQMFRQLVALIACAIVVMAPSVSAGEYTTLDSSCSLYARRPLLASGVISAYGEASCSIFDNRGVGVSLLWAQPGSSPDPVLATAYWEGSSDFHSREATIPSTQCVSGRGYYTKVWTYDAIRGTKVEYSSQLSLC